MTTNKTFWLLQDKLKVQFPENPESIKIGNKSKNSSVDVEGLGEVTIFKSANPLTFNFSSEFPAFLMEGNVYKHIPSPYEFFHTINTMKNSKKPVRFIVTNTKINLEVSIESFDVEEKGGDVGTLYFDLSLKEYKKLEARKVSIVNGKPILHTEVIRTSNRMISTIYTTKTHDTLWKISKSLLGNGGRWREIYNLNKDKIKNPDKLPRGLILMIPK